MPNTVQHDTIVIILEFYFRKPTLHNFDYILSFYTRIWISALLAQGTWYVKVGNEEMKRMMHDFFLEN